MPSETEHGRFVFFDMSADPPVVVFVKETDSNTFCAGGNSELVFLGAPFHGSRGTRDSENDEDGLPFSILKCPDVCISIVRTRNDAVGFGSPINSGH